MGNHELGSNFNDDPLWMILAVAQYIKETGDVSILDEKVPYEKYSGAIKQNIPAIITDSATLL